MMDIKKRLEEAKRKLQVEVGRFNSLEQEKQEVLKEMLRFEGEIRTLTELAKEIEA